MREKVTKKVAGMVDGRRSQRTATVDEGGRHLVFEVSGSETFILGEPWGNRSLSCGRS